MTTFVLKSIWIDNTILNEMALSVKAIEILVFYFKVLNITLHS